MKIVAISDTHGFHESVKLPKGDMLLFAGDMCSTRENQIKQVASFMEWFGDQDFKYKVLIAGNHDFLFQGDTANLARNLVPAGCHYLENSGIEIEGTYIWGTPATPWFFNWAFNYSEEQLAVIFEQIPEKTKILMTHCPMNGVLDKVLGGEHVGSTALASVFNIRLENVALHVHGHIHEAYGQYFRPNSLVTHANVSSCDRYYTKLNPAQEFWW